MNMRMTQGEPQIVPTDVPYTSNLVASVLRKLKERYPWMQIAEAGKSVMGRPISVMQIGTGAIEVFYNAAFHANEWITAPLLLKFAEEYLRAVDTGGTIGGMDADWLYRTFRLYLIPLVNPDGVDLVNGEVNSGEFYDQAFQIGQNYTAIPFPSGWKANIKGVDLNLQLPAGWQEARRIKFNQGYRSPAPRDYVGEGPLVAPESLAVYDFTLQHNFQLILAYHTQGEVIYWKYLNYNPPGARRIAEYFREVSGYEIEETPVESGYAGYKDWFIQDYNRPGYTVEVGRGVNPLPIVQFDQIYQANLGILVGGMVQLLV